MSNETVIRIADIRLVEATQPRAEMSRETVDEYAEAMLRDTGQGFPPVVVFRDESQGDDKIYWLADGFHRIHAALAIGLTEFLAEVHDGSLRDAVLYSASANSTHGLRRSQADKRRAVEHLLLDEEWQQWSDREIARWCQLSHQTVGRIRAEMVESGASGPLDQLENRKYVRDGQEMTMNTAGIGAGQGESTEEDRDDLTAWDQHAAGLGDQQTIPPAPTAPLHWRERWEQVKRDHPHQVVFIRGKPQVSLWLVLGADAVRVARILGIDPAVLEDMPPALEAIRLRLPSESISGPKPAWFVGLVRALDEQIFVYDEESEGFARAAQAVPASEILPRSLPANAFDPIEPTAAPIPPGPRENPDDDWTYRWGPEDLARIKTLEGNARLAEDLQPEDAWIMALETPEMYFTELVGYFDEALEIETNSMKHALLGFARSRIQVQGAVLTQTMEKLLALPDQLEALKARIVAAGDLGDLRQVNHDLSQLRLGSQEVDQFLDELQALSSARLKEIASGIAPGEKDGEEAAR